MTVPTLRSERLRLRGPALDDFPQSYGMWSDPAVTRFIGGRPHSKEEVWARLLRYIGHWYALGFGYWIVETIVGGIYVGEVGFSDYRRDLVPPLDGIPEMGWVLAPAAHGKGFALEAARAALGWRDVTLPPGEVFCCIYPDHARSLRVAGKLGFRRSGHALYHGGTRVILRRDSPPEPREGEERKG